MPKRKFSFFLGGSRFNLTSEVKVMDQSGILATAEGESMDWINELPNGILSSIISLLTIKDAVDTSMIACRWRNLWCHPILTRPNLEFDIPNIFGSRYVGPKLSLFYAAIHPELEREFKRQDFVSRVNNFLQLHHGKKVDSFKVAFFLNGENTAILDEWIRFAITKGVEVLDLQLFDCLTQKRRNVYAFPYWLLSELNASTLRHLSLSMCVLRPPPDFDKFNQLKTLCLHRVILDGNFMAHLFSVCLFLESLTLNQCTGGSDLIVAGPLLRLNDLKVILCSEIEKIEIYAVNLVSLEYLGSGTTISLIKTPQLATIYFNEIHTKAFAYALTQFAASPVLGTLHLYIYRSLLIPQSVPAFRNLKKLELTTKTFKSHWNDADLVWVLNLLKSTPLLEELLITVCGLGFHENQREIRNLSGFALDHLKRVKIQGFQSHSFEIEFAICILKNATKLETMVIDPFGKIYMYGEWDEVISINGSNPYWEEKRRAFVQEKLEEVPTDARVIIL